MAISRISYAQAVDDAITYLQQHTPITYTPPGSIARGLIEATVLEVVSLQNVADAITSQVFLDTAVGAALDRWGTILGVSRRVGGAAFVATSDQIIKFYVNSGTLWDYLKFDETRGVIYRGTQVFNDDRSISYSVTQDTYFDRSATETWVPAVSSQSGTAGNIGTGLLAFHNLSSTEIKVTNSDSIATGSEPETDANYRARLMQAFSAYGGGNPAAITMAVQGTPGISDFEIINQARGAGTYDVLLVPTGNRVSVGVMQLLQQALTSLSAFGISVKVREPEYTPISLIVTLDLKEDLGLEGLNVRTAVQEAILNYIANVPMGGTFVVNALIAQVMSVSSQIKDVALTELTLDQRAKLPMNFTLADDAVLIPDDSMVDPIRVF